MLTVPGLRAVKVLKLYQELGLSSLAEREAAAREGRLQKIKGLGASLQTKLLRGIEMRTRSKPSTKPADASARGPKRTCADPIVVWQAPSLIFRRAALRPSRVAS